MANTSVTYGNFRQRTVAGAAAGNITVPGIKRNDMLVSVQQINAAGANLVGEFAITADDTINNTGGTVTTGMTLLVTWEAYSGGRSGVRNQGRSNY